MKSRKLTLKAERLAELRTEELHEIAGANADRSTDPVNQCLSIDVCEITCEVRCLVPTLGRPSCAC